MIHHNFPHELTAFGATYYTENFRYMFEVFGQAVYYLSRFHSNWVEVTIATYEQLLVAGPKTTTTRQLFVEICLEYKGSVVFALQHPAWP